MQNRLIKKTVDNFICASYQKIIFTFPLTTLTLRMKINALIVDDEYSGRITLKILLEKEFPSRFGKIILVASLQEAIQKIASDPFHLCFLDVELNNDSGFDLLSHLPKETTVIFVTAYSEYAIKALRKKAYDYLLKPVNPPELKAAIIRYETEVLAAEPQKYLLLKEHGYNVPVDLREIEYLQANGPYSKIYLTNRSEYLMSKTLKAMSKSLNNDFIRIHKSYIVNKKMIQTFKKDRVITTTDICLPVSRVGARLLSELF